MGLLQQASLVITPNAGEAGKLFSIIPTDGAGDLDVVRNTTATYVGSDGLIKTAGINEVRFDYTNGSCPSILVEPQSTNQIRNNTMAGAVVGNPGTLPTNWTAILIGLSREVVGLGIEKGIQYIDVRLSGTASGVQQRIIFEPITRIVAATGQTWTLSTYLKLIATPQPPTNYRLVMFELTSAGGFVTADSQTITPTTSFARHSYTRTLSGGVTVARVTPIFEFLTITGQTYDFTVRVYGPQMEQLITATSLIQTTSAAVTRNADVISKSGLTGITTITETFENGTTNVISGNPTNYTMSQGRIKHVIGI